MRKNILIFVILAVIKCSLCQENSGDEDVGSGDSGLEIGEEVIEGSGSGDGAPVTVSHSVTYSMASSDGSFDIEIVLEERSDDSKLHLVCDVKSQVDKACPAQIFLISGHTSCSGLPDIVSAKKLADVESNGQDDVLVDAEYTELPGKCMIVLQPTSCSQSQEDGSGSGGGPEIIDAGDEENGVGRFEDEYFRVQKTVLRSAGFSRTYSSISLSGFNILSSGSTSAFTISVPSINIPVSSVPLPGVITTNYNKWDTLPYLQFPGWTYADALNIVGVIALILILSQVPRLTTLSFDSIQRRFTNLSDYADSDQLAARVDAFQDGMVDLVEQSTLNVAHPWVNLFRSLGERYYAGVNRFRNPDYNSPFSNGIRKIDEYEYDSYDDSSYNGHHDLQSESQIMNNFYDIFPDFNNFMSF